MNKVRHIEWEEISKMKSYADGGVQILRLQSPQSYRVRPVSKPCAFYRVYNEIGDKKLTAICSAETYGNLPGYVEGSLRYAFWVIDRADGMLKMVEAPKTVVSHLSTYVQITGQSPHDSLQGSDFEIKVTGTGIQTRYAVTTLAKSPLSEQDKAAIGTTDLNQQLLAHYQIQSYEQVMQKLQLRGTVSVKNA
jgi:hypothetical protein